MRESSFWKYVKQGMQGYWLDDRIETGTTKVGVPDVFYSMDSTMGWLELKVFESLPKREESLVKIKVTPLQVHWLKTRWGKNEGCTWLLARMNSPKEYYLFRGCDVTDKWTRNSFESTYRKKWEGRINFQSLAFILKNKTI